MPAPLITLTTDFGYSSPYVAIMKGVVLSLCPEAKIIDLSHAIRPQDVRHAAYLIATAAPHFPPGTIHVCVVDPGVGTARAALYTQVGGQHLVGPDNGLFTLLWRQCRGELPVVRRLTNSRFWRPQVSSTFHGRDIFAPVAAYLAQGIDPCELGPLHPQPEMFSPQEVGSDERSCWGEIQFIDDFGNLITNIPAALVRQHPALAVIGKRTRSLCLGFARTVKHRQDRSSACFLVMGMWKSPKCRGVQPGGCMLR